MLHVQEKKVSIFWHLQQTSLSNTVRFIVSSNCFLACPSLQGSVDKAALRHAPKSAHFFLKCSWGAVSENKIFPKMLHRNFSCQPLWRASGRSTQEPPRAWLCRIIFPLLGTCLTRTISGCVLRMLNGKIVTFSGVDAWKQLMKYNAQQIIFLISSWYEHIMNSINFDWPIWLEVPVQIGSNQ